MDLGELIEFGYAASHGIHGFVGVVIQPCLIFNLFLNVVISLAFILLVRSLGMGL